MHWWTCEKNPSQKPFLPHLALEIITPAVRGSLGETFLKTFKIKMICQCCTKCPLWNPLHEPKILLFMLYQRSHTQGMDVRLRPKGLQEKRGKWRQQIRQAHRELATLKADHLLHHCWTFWFDHQLTLQRHYACCLF